MPTFAIVFPLLEGKEAALRRFAKDLGGPQSKSFDESQRRLGISKESWFLQPSPGGHPIVITFDSPDVPRALELFSKSRDPFDVWFKDEVKGMTGVALGGPPPLLRKNSSATSARRHAVTSAPRPPKGVPRSGADRHNPGIDALTMSYFPVSAEGPTCAAPSCPSHSLISRLAMGRVERPDEPI